jgi:predicted NUDIX family NTP pyrophosphohydrolase
MPIQSAGLLMCRVENSVLEFFLIHPGGPFFAKKNEGVWSIPKGLPEENEELLTTAKREFQEETGITPLPPFYSLESVKLKSGKVVYAWSFLGAWVPVQGITSNYIHIEWPPRSKKFISIPEADRGAWMNIEQAEIMINPGQRPFLERANLVFKIL